MPFNNRDYETYHGCFQVGSFFFWGEGMFNPNFFIGKNDSQFATNQKKEGSSFMLVNGLGVSSLRGMWVCR